MVKNTIDVHEVYGLGVGTELSTKAYLVFCKTRSANLEFYKWFFEDVFVKFVTESSDEISHWIVFIYVYVICKLSGVRFQTGFHQILSSASLSV